MTDSRTTRRIGPSSGPLPSFKRDLSRSRQRLIELLQDLNFGRVEGLVVRAGEPVFDPLPRIIREVKFAADNEPRPERSVMDFQLKAQQVELIELLDRFGNGTIESIECRHGIPFRAAVPEPGSSTAA